LWEIHDYLKNEFSSFVHIRIEMKIDFKGFTLHITIRQFVQTMLGPDVFTILTPRRNFGNPPRNA
jgi:hypothetical protein